MRALRPRAACPIYAISGVWVTLDVLTTFAVIIIIIMIIIIILLIIITIFI
jgi:hypothetical protein